MLAIVYRLQVLGLHNFHTLLFSLYIYIYPLSSEYKIQNVMDFEQYSMCQG